MRQTSKSHGEKLVKDIKRATRRQYSSEEKIRIVLDGLRGGTVLPRCTAVRGFPKASITNGRRTSWKLETERLFC